MTWGGRPADRARAIVFAEETHCWICGREVDQTLPADHPMGRTVDHVHERQFGGSKYDRSNLRLAHRGCNTRKSNRLRRKRVPTVDIGIDDLVG